MGAIAALLAAGLLGSGRAAPPPPAEQADAQPKATVSSRIARLTEELERARRRLSVVCAERQELRDRVAQLLHDVDAARHQGEERLQRALFASQRTAGRHRLWMTLELIVLLALVGTAAKLWSDRRALLKQGEALWEESPRAGAAPRRIQVADPPAAAAAPPEAGSPPDGEDEELVEALRSVVDRRFDELLRGAPGQ